MPAELAARTDRAMAQTNAFPRQGDAHVARNDLPQFVRSVARGPEKKLMAHLRFERLMRQSKPVRSEGGPRKDPGYRIGQRTAGGSAEPCDAQPLGG